MTILDKIGAGIATTVDVIVEKNRQVAQLNRLAAIINTETEVINHAYIALGKHYYKILDKTEDEADMTKICEVIRFSEERRRKAQARYDYIKAFGMPKGTMDTVEMMRLNDIDYDTDDLEDDITDNYDDNDNGSDSDDITIAVADETDESSEETASQTTDEESESDDNSVEKAAEEPVREIFSHSNKRKRSHKKSEPADTEAEDDLTDL